MLIIVNHAYIIRFIKLFNHQLFLRLIYLAVCAVFRSIYNIKKYSLIGTYFRFSGKYLKFFHIIAKFGYNLEYLALYLKENGLFCQNNTHK